MLDGSAVVGALQSRGISHVVWIPDSHLGTWESSLLQATTPKLIRASREGEAIALAGGLILGGAEPVVVIQCTGLFEAGDALRNVVHDMGLPLRLIVGIRSYHAHREGKSKDNCPFFAERIVRAWELPYSIIDPNFHVETDFVSALRSLQESPTPFEPEESSGGRAGVIFWAE